MQMVHIEDKMIEKDGKIDWNRARKAKHGVAILSILFYIDNSKPQVTFCDQFSNIPLFNNKSLCNSFQIFISILFVSEPRTIVGKSLSDFMIHIATDIDIQCLLFSS